MTKIGMAATGLDEAAFRKEVLDNVYVMDTSLFPSPVGVNTQMPVMAVSTFFARKLAAAL